MSLNSPYSHGYWDYRPRAGPAALDHDHGAAGRSACYAITKA